MILYKLNALLVQHKNAINTNKDIKQKFTLEEN